ncbi:prepilin-type N-terminal cleavage/methylation domain-containing protein [Francisella sp. Scap27]|uniref:pilin n=1 Tax=Francisella sp. Scap27 TaxID=2589986 RepID=UPI0015BBF3D7|nr:prepilin-type N-terminal cleavage/methylation domain-containing protein [Francisella sp. Scap27]QLE79814.1 prepilin-type N-terminal cleavage/methylation domain-containing protein [Francisella sp. Scap27]
MKKQMQKGFSLVELMVVIAIIAILAAVAIPMYSNYTTRANVSSEISQLGGVKAQVAENIANTGLTAGDTITGVSTTGYDAPTGTTVTDAGVINRTSTSISGSTIRLTPALVSGAMTWGCDVTGSPAASSIPGSCNSIA